jgi:hypothetical protein
MHVSERLRFRLTDILETLDRTGEPAGSMFIDAIEVMTEGPERASRGAVSAETMAYVKRAMDARQ